MQYDNAICSLFHMHLFFQTVIQQKMSLKQYIVISKYVIYIQNCRIEIGHIQRYFFGLTRWFDSDSNMAVKCTIFKILTEQS